MNNIQQAGLAIIERLQLNGNVLHFAKQWANEHGLNNLEDLLALLDRIQLPYVLVPDLKQCDSTKHKCVVAVHSDTEVLVGECKSKKFITEQSSQGDDKAKYYLQIEATPLEKPDTDWVGKRLHAFRPLLPRLLFVSFISNLFALCVPFITMSIYDHVIGGDAGHELQSIAIGAGMLFVMIGLLRMMRGKVFIIVANRFSREVSQAIVLKLLNNSYEVNQQNTSTMQILQIQLAERLSGLLSGPLGAALFDIPFVVLFILAIGILGGYIVVVPIIALFLYFVLVKRYMKVSSKRILQSNIAGTNRQNMLNDLMAKYSLMRQAGMLKAWSIRFDKANHLAAKSGFSQSVIQGRYTSLYYLINTSSLFAVMGLGIELIFQGAMSAGGLIASMMLISKVTSPAQVLANSAMRLQSFSQSKVQLNRLMQQPAERGFTYQHHPLPVEPAKITVDQVTLRYIKQPKPALSAIDFTVEPGESLAIVGPSGSGKSTLMNVIAGLVMPHKGLVNLNDVNLSQYDPQLYRHWCFIRSSLPELMILTVREWLSDGREISDETMIDAITRVKGKPWLDSLRKGLDSELSSLHGETSLRCDVSMMGQILVNAKALVHDYPLYLLDNPIPDSHPMSKQLFTEFLESKRHKATVIYTSHDPEMIKLADNIVVLEEGNMVYAGPVPNK